MRKHLFTGFHSLHLSFGIGHGKEILSAFLLLGIGIGIKAWHNKRKEHDQNDKEQADHSHLILQETAHAVLPEADRFAHNDQALLFFFRGRQKIVCIQLKGKRILLHPYCPPSAQINPRIDDFVDHVNQEVYENHQRRKKDRCPHNHHIITVGNRADKFATESGYGKNLLNNE